MVKSQYCEKVPVGLRSAQDGSRVWETWRVFLCFLGTPPLVMRIVRLYLILLYIARYDLE